MAPQYARKVLKLLPKLAPDQRRDVLIEIQELAEAGDLRRRRRKPQEVVARTCGAFAHLPMSSEDFCREKQADIEREERKWRR